MKLPALAWVILGAILANGLLTGGGVNRALVHMPAWRHAGPLAWASFSRYADLGRNAMILYPVEAFAGMILSVAAAVIYVCRREAPRSAAWPIFGAAIFSIGGLLLTVKAAPIMLSIRHLGDNSASLQQAFDGFEFWGGWRSLSQGLAYLANLWSLAA